MTKFKACVTRAFTALKYAPKNRRKRLAVGTNDRRHHARTRRRRGEDNRGESANREPLASRHAGPARREPATERKDILLAASGGDASSCGGRRLPPYRSTENMPWRPRRASNRLGRKRSSTHRIMASVQQHSEDPFTRRRDANVLFVSDFRFDASSR